MQKIKTLSKLYSQYLIPSPLVGVGYLILVSTSLLTFWDDGRESIFLFGEINLYDITLSHVREEASKIFFYDLYSTFWLLVLLTYIPNKILFPLSRSFSVNQNLWMRMLPKTTVFDTAISNIYFLLQSIVLIIVSSLIWTALFSIFKKVDFQDLLIPMIGLVGQILFAVGLVFIICNNRKMPSSVRKGWVFLSLLFPILLYLIGESTARKLGGVFPYASPFAAKYTGHIVIKPFFTILFLGIVLLFHYVLKNYYFKVKNHQL